MSHDEFLTLVGQMREQQRARRDGDNSPPTFRRARALEIAVDEALATLRQPEPEDEPDEEPDEEADARHELFNDHVDRYFKAFIGAARSTCDRRTCDTDELLAVAVAAVQFGCVTMLQHGGHEPCVDNITTTTEAALNAIGKAMKGLP
jgi:hypothetical protein